MTKIKLSKSEKEQIRLNAKEYEREMLLEHLTDSTDENIVALVDEALVTVKMIHGDEIVEHMNVRIERDEQSLLRQKQMLEDSNNDREKMKSLQDCFGQYGSAGAAGVMGDWARLDNYGKHVWQDQEGNIWHDKSSSYDTYRRSVGLDPASGMWNTSVSAAGTRGTGLMAGSSADHSKTSMTKLVEQIQIMNDLKIDHSSLKDYLGVDTYNDLISDKKKKK